MKFNLKSVYSADKPYTVVEQLNKFVEYIDSIEYVAPGEYTRLFMHKVLCSFGQASIMLKLISPRQYPYEQLADFITDYRKYVLTETGHGNVVKYNTYSYHYVEEWFEYSSSTGNLYRYSFAIDYNSTDLPTVSTTPCGGIVSDEVSQLI